MLLASIGFPAWVFIAFMVAQLLLGMGVAALQAIGVPFAAINQTVFMLILSVLMYAIAITIVIGVPFWLKRHRTGLEELGLQRAPSWLDIAWAPAGFVVYLIFTALATAAATAWLPFVDASQVQETGFNNVNSQVELMLAFVALVVIAPVAEEVLFRGYLFGKLRRYAPVWLSILLTSLLFGIVHFQWNVGIDVFVLSTVLCVLRLVTKSLWAPILLHSLKNGIAFFLLFIYPSLSSTIGG